MRLDGKPDWLCLNYLNKLSLVNRLMWGLLQKVNISLVNHKKLPNIYSWLWYKPTEKEEIHSWNLKPPLLSLFPVQIHCTNEKSASLITGIDCSKTNRRETGHSVFHFFDIGKAFSRNTQAKLDSVILIKRESWSSLWVLLCRHWLTWFAQLDLQHYYYTRVERLYSLET